MLSFVRASAIVAGVTLAGLSAAPAFATDPAGNNGTVKVIQHGNIDDVPENQPHVGCTLDIEWYGFDEGEEIESTIGFELHSPTDGGELTVDGPEKVFVGGDSASGAGTEDGLDARQTYTLSATGLAHPKQGFHAKVTIHTPGSIGNDTKTKVFWVEPCTTTPATPEESPSVEASSDAAPDSSSDSSTPDAGVLGITASTDAPADVAPDSERASAAVPTAVDAGESSSEVLPDWARSPIALVVAAGGLVLIAVAIARRARTGA